MPLDIPEAQTFPVLKDKVALITGGAQGMGKATAEVFLKAGAKVVICDVQEDKGQEAAKELSSHGDVLFKKADISSSDDVAALVKFVVDSFGKLDAAVNNAALTPDKTPLTDFDEGYWDKLIGINLTGTALCVKWQMKQFIAQGTGGAIVNIASINAFKPQPNMPAYTAAKHALVGLTKHASMEGGPHNIRVNAVAPGAIFVSAPVNPGSSESISTDTSRTDRHGREGARDHGHDPRRVCAQRQLSQPLWHAPRSGPGFALAVLARVVLRDRNHASDRRWFHGQVRGCRPASKSSLYKVNR